MQNYLKNRKPKNYKINESQNEQKLPKIYTQKTKTKKRNFIICIILFFAIFLFLINPYLRYNPTSTAEYIKLPKSPEFKGNLEENNLLQNANYIAKGKLRGPETIIFINDTIYTGLLNGQIVRVDDEENVHKIFQIGEEKHNCNDFGLNIKSKKECGRPLGLRFIKPNHIYLIDAYKGLFKIDLKNYNKYQILSSNDQLFKNKPMVFGNDLDLDDENNIYFTDSSIVRDVNDAVELHVEARTDGRVFRYNEITKELELLLDNMRFPNGIQLTPNKDALIIAEHCMARLIKYYLKGEKKGKSEVLVNLPGFPDNIRISNHNTLFVALVLVRHSGFYKSALDFLGEYPKVRKIIATFFDLDKIVSIIPKYGLFLEMDYDGNFLRSWHDKEGKIIEAVTCVTHHDHKLYLGSFYHDYIGVIDY